MSFATISNLGSPFNVHVRAVQLRARIILENEIIFSPLSVKGMYFTCIALVMTVFSLLKCIERVDLGE